MEFLGKLSHSNNNNETFKNDQYCKLLRESMIKTYKKSNFNKVRNIDNKAKKITDNFPVADRIEKLKEKGTYITIKGHKDDFLNRTPCRLTNTCKWSIGKISIIIIIIVIKTLFTLG